MIQTKLSLLTLVRWLNRRRNQRGRCNKNQCIIESAPKLFWFDSTSNANINSLLMMGRYIFKWHAHQRSNPVDHSVVSWKCSQFQVSISVKTSNQSQKKKQNKFCDRLFRPMNFHSDKTWFYSICCQCSIHSNTSINSKSYPKSDFIYLFILIIFNSVYFRKWSRITKICSCPLNMWRKTQQPYVYSRVLTYAMPHKWGELRYRRSEYGSAMYLSV